MINTESFQFIIRIIIAKIKVGHIDKAINCINVLSRYIGGLSVVGARSAILAEAVAPSKSRYNSVNIQYIVII